MDSRTVAKGAFAVSFSNTSRSAAATRSASCRSVTSRKQTTNLTASQRCMADRNFRWKHLAVFAHTPEFACRKIRQRVARIRRQALQRLGDCFVLRDVRIQVIDAPADDFSRVIANTRSAVGLNVRIRPASSRVSTTSLM
jgi:hypothetical protein